MDCLLGDSTTQPLFSRITYIKIQIQKPLEAKIPEVCDALYFYTEKETLTFQNMFNDLFLQKGSVAFFPCFWPTKYRQTTLLIFTKDLFLFGRVVAAK